jgi:hypothetical protein
MSRMTLYPYAIDKMHSRKGTAVVYRFKRKLAVAPLIAPLVTGASADDMSPDIPPLSLATRSRGGDSESASEHHSPTSTDAAPAASAAAPATTATTAAAAAAVVADDVGADLTFDEVDGRKRIQSGTLRGLVRALADQDVQDKDYLDVFVMTYHYFTTAPALLDELAARFDLQPPAGQAADESFVRTKNVVQMRVVNVLKKWIQCNFADIAESDAARDALGDSLARMAGTGEGARGVVRHAAQIFDEMWCDYCEKRGLPTPLDSILTNDVGSPRVVRPRPAAVDATANSSRPSVQAPPSPRARRTITSAPNSPAPLSPRVAVRPTNLAPSTPTTPSSPRTMRPTGVAPPSPRANDSASAAAAAVTAGTASTTSGAEAAPTGSPTTRRKRRSNITTSTGAPLGRSSPKGSPLISRSDFSVARSVKLASAAADSDDTDASDSPSTSVLGERRDSRADALERRPSDAHTDGGGESSLSESRRDDESSEAASTSAANGAAATAAAATDGDDVGARCSIDDFTATQLAHQMTLDEFRIFARIDPVRELGLKTWEKRPECAPNIIALIERINDISWWTATEVIMKPTLKLRVDVVVKMIDVAQLLFELNNFNGLMEVTSGLNLSVVSRLKQLWENVPKKKIEQLRTLTEIMSPIGGYAAYRRELAKADGQAGGTLVSAIPFQGVYLSNLTAIEENANVLANGHVNFAKMWMLGRIFRSIIAFQRLSYDQLQADAQVGKFFRTIAKLNDDELWQLSLKLQPRTSAADEPSSPAKDSLAKRLLTTTRPRRNSLLGKSKNKSDLATQLADIDQSNEDEGVKALRKQMAMRDSPAPAARDSPASRFVRTVSQSGRTRSNSVNASLERAHSTSHT